MAMTLMLLLAAYGSIESEFSARLTYPSPILPSAEKGFQKIDSRVVNRCTAAQVLKNLLDCLQSIYGTLTVSQLYHCCLMHSNALAEAALSDWLSNCRRHQNFSNEKLIENKSFSSTSKVK